MYKTLKTSHAIDRLDLNLSKGIARIGSVANHLNAIIKSKSAGTIAATPLIVLTKHSSIRVCVHMLSVTPVGSKNRGSNDGYRFSDQVSVIVDNSYLDGFQHVVHLGGVVVHQGRIARNDSRRAVH